MRHKVAKQHEKKKRDISFDLLYLTGVRVWGGEDQQNFYVYSVLNQMSKGRSTWPQMYVRKHTCLFQTGASAFFLSIPEQNYTSLPA